MELYLASTISARIFAVLCWWAWKAGMKRDVEQYAMAPGSKWSGNYQKHLDRAMGFDLQRSMFYTLAAPGYPRQQPARAIMDLPVRPPHELLEEEDSVVGVWIINLTTGARHLCAFIRKAIICRCGCRGHCAWWPLLLFLRWSFAAAWELPKTPA